MPLNDTAFHNVWGCPVADDIMAVEDEWRAYRAEQHALIYAHFARQLVALIDGSSPRRFLDLAIEWELEALR